ncbi:MAG: fructose-1,6-bisphosphatase [Candidatus Aenigmarchaeota archaeon]|nr:fructose-1,6-bisphosphatase [Candidatus Aenigmarchaeota archaeon]
MAKTLEKHLENVDSELASLILKLSAVAKVISDELPYRRGKADTENVFGEVQLVADKWADQYITNELRESGMVKTLVSEEQPEIVKLNETGTFNITLDPLDGSSNIESNNSVGIIIGIYKKDLPAQGKDMVAAIYILYGSVISLVYAVPNNVSEFINTKRGFVLKAENIKISEPGILYGVGGLKKEWLPKFKTYIESLEKDGQKLRYGGSFVGDINQILHYGGIFAYPELVTKPNGKLRLLVESNTMAYVIKQAGGASSNGKCSILEIKPESITQRVPTYIGNKELIEKLETALK